MSTTTIMARGSKLPLVTEFNCVYDPTQALHARETLSAPPDKAPPSLPPPSPVRSTLLIELQHHMYIDILLLASFGV